MNYFNNINTCKNEVGKLVEGYYMMNANIIKIQNKEFKILGFNGLFIKFNITFGRKR